MKLTELIDEENSRNLSEENADGASVSDTSAAEASFGRSTNGHVSRSVKAYEVPKCLVCLEAIDYRQRNFKLHPSLNILVCKKCLNSRNRGEFTFDEQGFYEHCVLCGEGGEVTYGDCGCKECFCGRCLKNLIGRKGYNVIHSKHWDCFKCDPSQIAHDIEVANYVVAKVMDDKSNKLLASSKAKQGLTPGKPMNSCKVDARKMLSALKKSQSGLQGYIVRLESDLEWVASGTYHYRGNEPHPVATKEAIEETSSDQPMEGWIGHLQQALKKQISELTRLHSELSARRLTVVLDVVSTETSGEDEPVPGPSGVTTNGSVNGNEGARSKREKASKQLSSKSPDGQNQKLLKKDCEKKKTTGQSGAVNSRLDSVSESDVGKSSGSKKGMGKMADPLDSNPGSDDNEDADGELAEARRKLMEQVGSSQDGVVNGIGICAEGSGSEQDAEADSLDLFGDIPLSQASSKVGMKRKNVSSKDLKPNSKASLKQAKSKPTVNDDEDGISDLLDSDSDHNESDTNDSWTLGARKKRKTGEAECGKEAANKKRSRNKPGPPKKTDGSEPDEIDKQIADLKKVSRGLASSVKPTPGRNAGVYDEDTDPESLSKDPLDDGDDTQQFDFDTEKEVTAMKKSKKRGESCSVPAASKLRSDGDKNGEATGNSGNSKSQNEETTSSSGLRSLLSAEESVSDDVDLRDVLSEESLDKSDKPTAEPETDPSGVKKTKSKKGSGGGAANPERAKLLAMLKDEESPKKSEKNKKEDSTDDLGEEPSSPSLFSQQPQVLQKKSGNVSEDDASESEPAKEEPNKCLAKCDRLLRQNPLKDLDSEPEAKKTRKRRAKIQARRPENDAPDEAGDGENGPKAAKKRKKQKRRIFSSSEDEDKNDSNAGESADGDDDDLSIGESGSDQSEAESETDKAETKKRQTRTSKKAGTAAVSAKKGGKGKKKGGRRRVKIDDSDDNGDEKKSSEGNDSDVQLLEEGQSTSKGRRRNIRKILSDKKLSSATKDATKAEQERQSRLKHKQAKYNFIEVGNELECNDSPEKVHKVTKLTFDINEKTKVPILEVDQAIVKRLKPHQAAGAKFMFDSAFETVEKANKDKSGGGAILAHCMGLGKSLQVITLLHAVLRSDAMPDFATALIVAPLNTVLNWKNEFHKWVPEKHGDLDLAVYELSSSSSKPNEVRISILEDWQQTGGVAIMNYEMFRNLADPTNRNLKKRQKIRAKACLIDPGPDIVICDEGHLLKNENSKLNTCMSQIRTKRRLCLTGTPLQNNLSEYHTMVQFVKPSLLGNSKEFKRNFVNPIKNGQSRDSTPQDVRLSKRRAHVLHQKLSGTVHRCDYSVLKNVLPPKYEYALSIRLSPRQEELYRHYLDTVVQFLTEEDIKLRKKLFTDFQNLQRVYTHPYALKLQGMANEIKRAARERKEELEDFIADEDDEDMSNSSRTPTPGQNDDDDVQVIEDVPARQYTTRSRRRQADPEDPEFDLLGDAHRCTPENDLIPQKTWWDGLVQEEDEDDIELSGKLCILMKILRKCEAIGDKLLVFSQSLISLDLIEKFLQKLSDTWQDDSQDSLGHFSAEGYSWEKGEDYYRMDGQVENKERNRMIDAFNDPTNLRARLFLVSTRAGSLGINLVAANRVVIFDACWNPSHDTQSIFRVYRFGQTKPCYIYRFIAQGTMEEKIYDRQVQKMSLACQVVDEQSMERHFTAQDLVELYEFFPDDERTAAKRGVPSVPKDKLFAELLSSDAKKWIVTHHEHDSLLQEVYEERLTEEEKKAAWEEFERGMTTAQPSINPIHFQIQQIQKIMQEANALMPYFGPNEVPNIQVFATTELNKKPNDLEHYQAVTKHCYNLLTQIKAAARQRFNERQLAGGGPVADATMAFQGLTLEQQKELFNRAQSLSLEQKQQLIAQAQGLNMQQKTQLLAQVFANSAPGVPGPSSAV